MNEEDYIKRLEKIIDKQNDLLTHFDAKFEQQESLNETLSNQNNILREDIKKHKNLLMDMNKTVNQHKNVVNKLKKELEEQLQIQQKLHKDYGEVIKELTDELEQYQEDDGGKVNKIENDSSDSDKVTLPPKDFEKDYISSATGLLNDIKDKSADAVNDLSKQDPSSQYEEKPKNEVDNKCPNCGAEVKEGFIFCDSCGTKLN